MQIPKLDPAVIEAYKKLDSTSISDALDRLGIPGGLYGIKPVTPGVVMCGQAFTVRYVPCGEVKGTVGDFLDDVEPGQVCVLDNGGRDYCTVWGDIMAMAASMKEIAGTLIYGVCRDVKDVRAIRYPSSRWATTWSPARTGGGRRGQRAGHRGGNSRSARGI